MKLFGNYTVIKRCNMYCTMLILKLHQKNGVSLLYANTTVSIPIPDTILAKT